MPKDRNKFREIDDKIVEAIKELDSSINSIIEIIVEKHPEFIIDFLVDALYIKGITTGGVRVFSGSRKKKSIKFKLFDLVLYVKDKTRFMQKIHEEGLIRGVKEELVQYFLNKVQENYVKFIQIYGDPFPTYRKIYPIYHNYLLLREAIAEITFRVLSRVVLSKYNGWKNKRCFDNSSDYFNYEEDTQNSSFSINKSIRLFDISKHKSFFSYTSSWIKEGISSSEYTIEDKKYKNNIRFISIDEILKSEEPTLTYEDEENLYYDNHSTFPNLPTVNNLIEDPNSDFSEIDEIPTLHFIKSAYPIPNELRIFFRILQNL